jgi:hypothetical protein
VRAQDTVGKQKLLQKDCYEYALREYILSHPSQVITAPGRERTIFVRSRDFLSSLKDTLAGVRVKMVDENNSLSDLVAYFPKKQKFVLLDVQKMIGQAEINHLWIIPMKTSFNPKKKELSELKYEKLVCKYTFDYTPRRDQYFLFKESKCGEQE